MPPGSRIELRIGVLLQRQGDQRTQPPALWPRLARGEAYAVVSDHDRAPISIDHAVQRNRPALSAAKCVLERICQKLVDHETRWHGHVYRDRVGVNPGSSRMPSTACEAITAVAIWLRYTPRSISSSFSDKASASYRSTREAHPARQSLIAGLIGGRGVPRLHTDESGNHLQIVLYPMLQFAQPSVLFSNAGFERLRVHSLGPALTSATSR